MNSNYFQMNHFFLVFISIILCFNAPVTHGETQAAREIQESEEFENSLVRNVQNDYRNGFGELLKFINSLNDTLTFLNAKLATQDTALNAQNIKIEAGFKAVNERLSDIEKIEVGCKTQNESISAPETTQKAESDQQLATQDTVLSAQNTKIEAGLNAQNETLSAQGTTLKAKVDQISRETYLLLSHASPNLNEWEGFENLIRAQAKEIKTGKSFNGSTLSDIKSRAAQVGFRGWHTAIVFVNQLDEAIGDFTIHDEYNTRYNPAPNTVQGRTQEIFTFATPKFYGVAWTSFSYQIPSLNIRVAAISNAGTHGVGLAFVSKGTDMKTYYDSHEGIEGSTVWECCGWMDRNLSVGYKNLYARMFADYEEDYKSTLRIELIKLPLDD